MAAVGRPGARTALVIFQVLDAPVDGVVDAELLDIGQPLRAGPGRRGRGEDEQEGQAGEHPGSHADVGRQHAASPLSATSGDKKRLSLRIYPLSLPHYKKNLLYS